MILQEKRMVVGKNFGSHSQILSFASRTPFRPQTLVNLTPIRPGNLPTWHLSAHLPTLATWYLSSDLPTMPTWHLSQTRPATLASLRLVDLPLWHLCGLQTCHPDTFAASGPANLASFPNQTCQFGAFKAARIRTYSACNWSCRGAEKLRNFQSKRPSRRPRRGFHTLEILVQHAGHSPAEDVPSSSGGMINPNILGNWKTPRQ